MGKVFYYKRNMGEYARDTLHLSQGQVGAYDLLIDWYYSNGGPIPANEQMIFNATRAITEEEKANARLVVDYFFTRDGAVLRSKRADVEIAKLRHKGDTARANGAKSQGPLSRRPGSTTPPRRLDTAPPAAPKPAVDAGPPSPPPKPQAAPPAPAVDEFKFVDAPLPGKRGQYTPAFEAFWNVYPNKQAKLAAFKAWAKLKVDDALLAQILADVTRRNKADDQWARGFAPYAQKYLNGKRWLDDGPAASPAAPSKRAAVERSNEQAAQSWANGDGHDEDEEEGIAPPAR